MKKLILAILGGLAMNVGAVTFQWSTASQVSFGDSLVSSLSPSTFTAQLVYLGTDGKWTEISILDTGIDLGAETKVDGTVTSVSGKTGAFANRNSKASSTTKNGVANGTYSLLLTYVDNAGTSWFNLSSSTYTVPADADESTTGLSASFAFASGKTEVPFGEKLAAGGGWYTGTPIPEPSSAALALAGLALLIKRRRA